MGTDNSTPSSLLSEFIYEFFTTTNVCNSIPPISLAPKLLTIDVCARCLFALSKTSPNTTFICSALNLRAPLMHIPNTKQSRYSMFGSFLYGAGRARLQSSTAPCCHVYWFNNRTHHNIECFVPSDDDDDDDERKRFGLTETILLNSTQRNCSFIVRARQEYMLSRHSPNSPAQGTTLNPPAAQRTR